MYRSYSIKKTRKTHRCDWCWKLIPTGSQAIYHSGVWEGDFFCGHLHLECNHALNKHCQLNPCEGYERGDFARGSILEDGEPMYNADGTLTPYGKKWMEARGYETHE